MFEQIEDKEKYLIQPYIEGEKVLIKISCDDDVVNIKQFNKNNRKIHMLKRIENELTSFYKNSKFFKYNIILKGFIVRNYKNLKTLILYDIMTLDEYELKVQSKKYSTRLENLNIRFLTSTSKNIRSIFSYQYNEHNLKIVYDQFVKNNVMNGYVFRKNIPYKYDDNEVIIENVCNEQKSSIIDFVIGTTLKQENDEENNNIKSSEQIPCVQEIKIMSDDGELSIKLDNVLDSEKVKYFNEIDEIRKKNCIYKEYKFLDHHDFIFVKFQ